MTPFSSKQLCQFDRFRLDLGKKVLWENDELVHLPPKAIELLCELVEKHGEVVTKDELLSRVWSDAFVEEGVLTQNIHYLRKAFKDLNLPSDPIQTVPRRGYRFAGEVHAVPDEIVFEHEIVERNLLAEISDDSLRDLGLRAPEIVSKASPRRRRLAFALSALTLVTIAITGVIVWRFTSPRATAPIDSIKSVAVLPLKTLNSDGSNETFALGLTDTLIGRLGRLSGVTVRPFSAVEKYEASGKDAIAFARDLSADAALEGTIQNDNGRLRVNLRLIDSRDGAQIWADSFDESEKDSLTLQDIVSMRVAKALVNRLEATDEKVLARSPTSNPEAFRLYLAGREAWLKRDSKVASLEFYRKAIELDPTFALPYLGIADEYAFTYETKTAEDALAKVLELDPSLHEAYATRGFLQMFHHWDWAGAESSFRRALELAPQSSKAHHWYGVYLSIRGRLEEAEGEMQKALELDPTALVVMTDLAELHYFNHDYARAQSELERVLAIDPTFINAHQHLVKVRYMNGGSYFLEDASFTVLRHQKIKSDGLAPEGDVTRIETLIGNRDENSLKRIHLQSALESAKSLPASHLALSRFFAISGEKERSLDELEKAIDARVFVVPFVAVDPLWDPLRDEPRFQQLIRRMNLKAR